MIERKVFQDTMVDVSETLSAGCSDVRFCLVVWCECCADRPLYIGGNEEHAPQVLKMLAAAGNAVEIMEGIEGGRA